MKTSSEFGSPKDRPVPSHESTSGTSALVPRTKRW